VVVASSTNASVLLTGASRGLGYALAEEHLEHGSRVVATVWGPGRTVLHDLQQGVGGRLEIEQVVTNELTRIFHRVAGERCFAARLVAAG